VRKISRQSVVNSQQLILEKLRIWCEQNRNHPRALVAKRRFSRIAVSCS